MENQVMLQNQVVGTSVKKLGEMMQYSSALAKSTIIPETFRGNPSNVLIALEMAERMNASWFAIMQNMYIVYGNPSFSSKFLIGCFNNCGRFTSIKYEFFGEPGTDSYGCRAYATEKATKERVQSIDVTIGMAKAEGWFNKNGSKWKTIPQLMMQYRAASFLIRTVAPELSLGLQSTEELQDTIDLTADGSGSFVAEKQAVEDEIKAVSEKAAVVDIPAATVPPAAGKVPAETTKKNSQPSWMND